MGLTQEAIAGEIGLSVDTVSLVERGKISPSLDTLETFANGLEIRLPDLLDFGDRPSRDAEKLALARLIHEKRPYGMACGQSMATVLMAMMTKLRLRSKGFCDYPRAALTLESSALSAVDRSRRVAILNCFWAPTLSPDQ
jgi:transcriptional regulator with XRE-family HTH domain